MHLRVMLTALAILASVPVSAMAANEPSTKFNVNQPTLVPGGLLQPGTYSIRVVDHLQDRFIVGIEKNPGSSHTLFIAVPSKALKKTGSSGAIPWDVAPNGKSALRGFDFGKGSLPIEFVYPKDDAISLAKANHIAVLAVDPASEGKSSELSQLSNDDMQMVTLWTLSPVRVGANASQETTISASKYQNGEELASVQQVGQVDKRPSVLKKLPHTASYLPLVLIVGLLTSLFAIVLRMARRSRLTVIDTVGCE